MRSLSIGVFLLVGLLGAADVQAQVSGDIDALRRDLSGEDGDAARVAASALGSLKSEAARDVLIAALQLGSSPDVCEAIVEALGEHGDPTTKAALRPFLRHRRVQIRLAAMDALAKLEDATPWTDIIAALSDENPMARAKAARLLGQQKISAAEEALFQLVAKGERSAATPLSAVASVESAQKLGELLGQIPGHVLVESLGPILLRPDFGPDTLRTEVITTMAKIRGDRVVEFLGKYLQTVPSNELRMSKNLAIKLLKEERQARKGR